MSRKIIAHASYILEEIFNSIDNIDITKLRIQKTQEYAADCLIIQHFKCSEKLHIDRYIMCVLCEYDSKKYIAIQGVRFGESEISELHDSGVVAKTLTAPYGIVLYKEMGTKRKDCNRLEIEDKLGWQHHEDGYVGHEFDSLSMYMNDVYLFEILQNSTCNGIPGINSAYFVLSHIQSLRRLDNHQIFPSLRNLLLLQSLYAPENVWNAMTANMWKYAFIEVYRIVEWLYIMPRSIMLKNAIQSSLKASEIGYHAHKSLGWRRKEDESLVLIFRDVNYSRVSGVEFEKMPCLDYLRLISSEDDWENYRGSVARDIYAIRNQIVHQFDKVDEKAIVEDEWKHLTMLLIAIVQSAYDCYSSELS